MIFLLRVQEAQLTTPIIIMTGQTTLTNAVEAMKRGAFDYLPKPFDLEEVEALAARACEAQQLTVKDFVPVLATPGKTEQIIGHSMAMQEIYKVIGRVVKNDATVLIQGESGTGKRTHRQSHSPLLSSVARAVCRDQLFSDPDGSA